MALAIARHFKPRRAVPRRTTWETRTDPTWIESLLTESVRLNQTGRSFTRATSAWDFIHNCILAPGQARQVYARYRDRVSIPMDLPEGAGTNLLAAGLSDHLELANGGIVSLTIATGQTALDGSATACKLQEADTTAESHLAAFNIGWTNGTVYTMSCHFKAAERTYAAIGVSSAALTGGGTAIFNLTNGTVQSSPGSFTCKITYAGGGWWRCTCTFTATATATAGMFLYTSMQTTTNYAGTVGSGVLACWAGIQATAFPTSFISNRNLIPHSQSTTGWGTTHVTATGNFAAGPLGDTTATRVQYAGSLGANSTFYSDSSGNIGTASKTFTVSCWLMSNTGSNQTVRLDNSHGGVADQYSANLTVTSMWQRFTFTVTNNASAGSGVQAFALCPGTGDGAFDVLIWGAQLEYGSSATPYWGTNATVGGRDADNLTASLTSLPGGGTSTTGGTLTTILVPYGWTTSQPGTNARLYDDVNATGTTKGVVSSSNGIAQVFITDSGGGKSGFVNGVPTPVNLTPITYSEVWDSAHLTGYVAGTAGTPIATVPPYTSTTSLLIGANDGPTAQINGYEAVIYEPRPWTALETKLIGQYANLALGQA